MSAVLATRPPLHRRAWRALRIACLSFLIWDLRRYIAECERHRILNTESMAEFRKQLQTLRVARAIAESST